MLNSPCGGNCKLDIKTNLCISCYRTMEEILSWINLNDDQRKKINDQAEYRKTELSRTSNKKQ